MSLLKPLNFIQHTPDMNFITKLQRQEQQYMQSTVPGNSLLVLIKIRGWYRFPQIM